MRCPDEVEYAPARSAVAVRAATMRGALWLRAKLFATSALTYDGDLVSRGQTDRHDETAPARER